MSARDDLRWTVERTSDVFDDVGAAGLTVLPSGALWFTDADGELLVAYAHGQWMTVFPEAS